MGEVKRSTAEIQRDIERIRESLTRDVGALEATVRDKLDWRRPIREQPVQAVGAAFAVGFLLGLL
jgi:ElaB/YqjD/DUF883 family membrane-anchored ribosome-binding protein